MPIRPRNILATDFGLRGNPFKGSQIYNVDDQAAVYVPEMYGDKLKEFYKKFFLLPLTKESNKQVIGAIWSSHAGDDWGRGFGKSMMMAEESKLINDDLGRTLLERADVEEEDIAENPILAGYCTFDEAKGVKSFAAALLDAVIFILESKHGDGTVHTELRRRLCAKLDTTEGYEGEEIKQALLKDLRRLRGLNVQLTHATLDGFIDRLCGDDTGDLVSYIRHEIGPRIKAAQGFNYVHVFNAFVSLAGIVYVVYFIDQIENFARWARKQDKEIKMLRESMCQTCPTSDIASFIFQMHLRAETAIEDWWNSEHLPSLSFSKPINASRVVDLKGLQNTDEASALAARYLEESRAPDAEVPSDLHPFSEDVIEEVRLATSGNPRKFLETLGHILDHAELENHRRIDLAFIQPLLNEDVGEDAGEVEDDDYTNPDRG
jgi:hypothetical protein